MNASTDTARPETPTTFTVTQFRRLHRLGALFGQPWARTPVEKYLHADVQDELLPQRLRALAGSVEAFPEVRGHGVPLHGEQLSAVVFRSGAARVWLNMPGRLEDRQGFWLPEHPADARRLGVGDAPVPPPASFGLLVDAYLALVRTDLEMATRDVQAIFGGN